MLTITKRSLATTKMAARMIDVRGSLLWLGFIG